MASKQGASEGLRPNMGAIGRSRATSHQLEFAALLCSQNACFHDCEDGPNVNEPLIDLRTEQWPKDLISICLLTPSGLPEPILQTPGWILSTSRCRVTCGQTVSRLLWNLPFQFCWYLNQVKMGHSSNLQKQWWIDHLEAENNLVEQTTRTRTNV